MIHAVPGDYANVLQGPNYLSTVIEIPYLDDEMFDSENVSVVVYSHLNEITSG